MGVDPDGDTAFTKSRKTSLGARFQPFWGQLIQWRVQAVFADAVMTSHPFAKWVYMGRFMAGLMDLFRGDPNQGESDGFPECPNIVPA